MVAQQVRGRAGPSQGPQDQLVQHSYPNTHSWRGPVGQLGKQVEDQELTGAAQLSVLGPGPGQPPSSDSIHPGHDGQLGSTHHYTALTTTFDAASTGVVWQLRWTAAVVISREIREGQM